MKKIEELLPSVLPAQNEVVFNHTKHSGLEPFAKIGIVPTASFAYQAVSLKMLYKKYVQILIILVTLY